MNEKNICISIADRLLSVVDLIKWTSTFGTEMIEQMESPVSGLRVSPALSGLFGMVKGGPYPMLAMHPGEASWLRHLPVDFALVGYDRGLILVTEGFSVFDQAFSPFGISVHVPLKLHADLQQARMIGFAFVAKDRVETVNRLVPLYTPERYREERVSITERTRASSLFSG
ncbi:hypothetical protein [Pandoraea sp. ISTKB]|uniref:hypothetical protein n=1 Tax=Pandoraea sp. ISTKB TaxID=1586708 RepID=UPI000847C64B|nr:hypothetical protein [Pandoraea sp. ISTKB]ODP35030.1 hypothetical protein A9762_11740 [Pandoraea sp. ISTKB]